MTVVALNGDFRVPLAHFCHTGFRCGLERLAWHNLSTGSPLLFDTEELTDMRVKTVLGFAASWRISVVLTGARTTAALKCCGMTRWLCASAALLGMPSRYRWLVRTFWIFFMDLVHINVSPAERVSCW